MYHGYILEDNILEISIRREKEKEEEIEFSVCRLILCMSEHIV